MNRIATGLLGVVALVLVGFGIERAVYWASTPFGTQFGAGEAFGIFFGLVIAGLGAGVALAAIALSTPGPPPVPLPISIGGAVIGLSLLVLAIARAFGRRAP